MSADVRAALETWCAETERVAVAAFGDVWEVGCRYVLVQAEGNECPACADFGPPVWAGLYTFFGGSQKQNHVHRRAAPMPRDADALIFSYDGASGIACVASCNGWAWGRMMAIRRSTSRATIRHRCSPMSPPSEQYSLCTS